MIVSLAEAQIINPEADRTYIDALETLVRSYTNNNFQIRKLRLDDVFFTEPNMIQSRSDPVGFLPGNTIEINHSDFNDGLYVIEAINGRTLTTVNGGLINEDLGPGIVTLIEYPADIIHGVKKLIKYDLKMGEKIGIKSETISRMSITYYDMNATETIEGYPSSLVGFLDKYKKLRW